MNTTITLSPSTAAGFINIAVGDETIAAIKDGPGLMRRVDDHLRAASIVRGGFASVDGVMVATGADLR